MSKYAVRYDDGTVMSVPSYGHAVWNLTPGAVIEVQDDNESEDKG